MNVILVLFGLIITGTALWEYAPFFGDLTQYPVRVFAAFIVATSLTDIAGLAFASLKGLRENRQ